MRILALETTDRRASLAAMDGDNLSSQLTLEPTKRSAQTLAPGVAELLDQAGWTPADVTLVAVSLGPGSFTGVRIGVTTAKALAYARGADILGIDTLEAIAAATPPEFDAVWVAVDAQRGEAMVRPFRRGAQAWFEPVAAVQRVDAAAWIATLGPGSLVSGPLVERIADRLPPGVLPAPPELRIPTALQVARLARRDYLAGRRDDLWSLAPRYSRPSAAEEKRQRRDKV